MTRDKERSGNESDPWNSQEYKDDPRYPWNDPTTRDDPRFAWNSNGGDRDGY